MIWHDVGPRSELETAGRLVARVGGREVGVLLGADGEPRAVRNRCPHHGAPLCRGPLSTRLEGGPGEYALSGEQVLRCPWHGWEFRLTDGACPEDPRLRVAVYRARIEGDRVLVEA